MRVARNRTSKAAGLLLVGLLHVVAAQSKDGSSSIADLVAETSELSILSDALLSADLREMFASSAGNYTLFAPTNDAFATLLQTKRTLASRLLYPQFLTTVLTYHVLGTPVSSGDITSDTRVPTLAGPPLAFSTSDGIKVENGGEAASVVVADIPANNGIVHVIDRVLMVPV